MTLDKPEQSDKESRSKRGERKKRTEGILAILALTGGLLYAATVTVTKPASGETWAKGTAYFITWTKDGAMPAEVRITLRNAATLNEVAVIADPAPNTGSYSWTIPANTPDGQYRVRVKVKDVAVSDDSDAFNIAAGGITILEPVAGTVWHEAQGHVTQWLATGLSGSYSVSLMDSTGTNVVKILVNSCNCCSVGTAEPMPFVPGSYRVRVKNIATNIFADSQVFTLSPDNIVVIKPDAQTVWHKNENVTITWKRTGTQPSTVKIEMTGAYHQVLDLDAPNTGSFSWTVPTWYPVGKYQVTVSTDILGLMDKSPQFNIAYIQVPKAVVKTKIK